MTLYVYGAGNPITSETIALRNLIGGADDADISALTTTDKSSLVAAINELDAGGGGGGAEIDDENISTVTTWSSDKIDDSINTAVTTGIATVIDTAPGTLDTLNELAASLGDDADFAGTMTTALATKAPLNSPTLTGTPAAPTASASTNTTQIATTAFVMGEIGSHNHDGRYYTETEIDALLLALTGVTTANPSGGAISIDAATVRRNVESTLDGAATLNVPTNGANGQVIEVAALASGAQRVLTFHASLDRLDGVGSTLTIPSGKVGRATLRRTDITGSAKWIVEASGVSTL